MIKITGLQQSFGTKNLFTQTGEIEIGAGINCLVGANGSGKTTFLKILVGVISPTSGTVKYNNASIAESLKSIGIVFDQPYFYPYLTGLENLYYFNSCSDYRVNKEEIKQVFEEWNIGDDKLKYRYYSFGMKKKLNIVYSLMKNPDYWFLDEPFNGLDIDAQLALTKKLWQMGRGGKTVIVSTHDLSSIIGLADHIIAIDKGLLSYHPNVAGKLERAFTHTIRVEKTDTLPGNLANYVLDYNRVEDVTELIINTQFRTLALRLLREAGIDVIEDKPNYDDLSEFLRELRDQQW